MRKGPRTGLWSMLRKKRSAEPCLFVQPRSGDETAEKQVKLSYPAGEGNKDWTLGPLYQPIDPEGCSFRILGSKVGAAE